ncbi:ABC transporter permease subunit [Mycoplasma phocoenae]|uniref:ABC transporter permease subunit n=1 Tax=Mycoplasma phocoenae TaxID=754517 RepID=A0A858U3J5_9MOLU|nr:ABC transporter permease subunit [Mycoplasma phocoenae]QJG67040.1 ABC transporter permease subunit [Mycoplasma phocoenae]
MRNRKNNSKKQIKINKNFFYYQVESYSDKSSKKIRPFYFHIFLLLFIALIIGLWFSISNKIRIENIDIFIKKTSNLFEFKNKSSFWGLYTETNLIKLVFKFLYISIKYGLVGTFIGFLLAFATSLVSTELVTNKYLSKINRILILIIRAIPEIVFIKLFISTFMNEMSLLFVYIWFTWLWLHKYYCEILDTIDRHEYYVSIKQGNNKFNAFKKEILPRIKNRYLTLFLFSFESNIRWTSILGILSLPGLGALIKHGSQDTYFFKELGIPLTVLILFVLCLEFINIKLKKCLFEHKTKELKYIEKNKQDLYKKLSKKKNYKQIILSIILVLLIVYSVIVLIQTPFLTHNSNSSKQFLKAFFTPDFREMNWRGSNSIFSLLSECFTFALLSMSLTILISLVYLRFMSTKLNNKYTYFLARNLNSLNRLIPTVVLFLLFKPLLSSPLLLILILLGIHESSNISKQLVEAIDNLDEEVIKNLKSQGYSNNYIYKKYALPSIKHIFISLSIFYFELAFRSSITYSVFANEDLHLGNEIWMNLDINTVPKPRVAMSYVWVATICILLINSINILINQKIFKRKKYEYKI